MEQLPRNMVAILQPIYSRLRLFTGYGPRICLNFNSPIPSKHLGFRPRVFRHKEGVGACTSKECLSVHASASEESVGVTVLQVSTESIVDYS